MSKVNELLEAVKSKNEITSDYALAKLLDLPSSYICDFNKGKRSPNEYACLQIAKALERDYAEVSAIVRIEAEKDEKRKEEWRRFYKSMGGIAASFGTLLFFGVTLIVTPTPAQAMPSLLFVVRHFVLC